MSTNGAAPRRPIRVAGCSAGVYDRKRALHDLAKNEDVDVITGDWMSECNMTWRGSDKRERLAAAAGSAAASTTGYEPSFVLKLDPAIPWLAKRGIKVAVNAGASDVAGLAATVAGLCRKHGVDLKVGYVDGDDVTDAFMELYKKGEPFLNLPQDKPIQEWGFEPQAAQCYLGGSGVAACFAGGADIVVCGRVSDASLAVGAAMWWHGWTRADLPALAGALMVGHIIECGTYATGGYYSGFKALAPAWTDFGYPIAAIDHKGEAVISMERGRHGLVTVDTVTSQLLYEIQGPLYFNSDVTAVIDDMVFTQVGPNQVHVGGVKGLPPPPTTKVGVTARGGYQAEFHFYITGLDAAEKAAMMEAQVRTLIGPDDLAKFSLLEFHCAGSPRADADSQDAATVDLRVVAQSAHRELLADDLVGADRATFASYCIENLSQGYPGSTMAIDMRSAVGRPYFEYWACLMPQSFVVETAHLPGGRVVAIPTPPVTQAFPRDQPTAPATADPVADLAAAFGPTTRAPLGYVVLGRSGDKSSNANVGFFVRRDDEWQWLRSLLSVATLRQLLGKDDSGKPIERFELPRLRAVHFLLKDHLDRGFNSTAGFDSLGKNLGEYLRSRYVDIPNRFLERGRI